MLFDSTLRKELGRSFTGTTVVLVTIVVSLFTRPKPEAELKNLVMGLTPLPKEEASPWHRKPLFWAAVVMAVFIVINIIFW